MIYQLQRVEVSREFRLVSSALGHVGWQARIPIRTVFLALNSWMPLDLESL